MEPLAAILLILLIFIGIVIYAAFLPVLVGGSIVWAVFKLHELDRKTDDDSIDIRCEIRFADD